MAARYQAQLVPTGMSNHLCVDKQIQPSQPFCIGSMSASKLQYTGSTTWCTNFIVLHLRVKAAVRLSAKETDQQHPAGPCGLGRISSLSSIPREPASPLRPMISSFKVSDGITSTTSTSVHNSSSVYACTRPARVSVLKFRLWARWAHPGSMEWRRPAGTHTVATHSSSSICPWHDCALLTLQDYRLIVTFPLFRQMWYLTRLPAERCNGKFLLCFTQHAWCILKFHKSLLHIIN